uniref:microtubule-associated protein 9 n=1 Tax=Jaculus jaculus TaxID=51337 RepID=UPI001E1B15C2|nr:microtubule-associated protein 9 [Jaculus jaculus]
MSDEVFSTTLAYTRSPKVTKRTSFQDELIRAITARSARQRSSEYSDDFESDELVSLGEFSDASVDENPVKKKVNDFHISDDEEKISPRLSFLKTKKPNGDITKDKLEFIIKNHEEMASDGCEDIVENTFSKSESNRQEVEKERIKMTPKPRNLPIKSPPSEKSGSLETEDPVRPSPRPRSLLKVSGCSEEKNRQEDHRGPAPSKDEDSLPPPQPRQNGALLDTEEKPHSEDVDLEDSLLQSLSLSSLKESVGNSFSPESGDKTPIKGHEGELTENFNSVVSNENEGHSVLIDSVTPELEKPSEGQVDAVYLEDGKKAGLTDDDLTADSALSTSQSVLSPTSVAESVKKTVEDKNTKNKKSTNRISSASGRLMTSEFLKKSSSVRRTPSTTTSSQYLGTLKVLDQKPPRKQSLEPDKADHIRAAVYQEWLEKKNVHLHEMHKIKRIESENLRIQNEQKKAAKREEALASFEAWKAMKEKEAKKIAAKKRLEEKNKKKTEEENAARKGEAVQAFEKWKEKKMEYLKEKNRKEKEYERAKKQKEEEAVAEKKKDNLAAFEKWNEKKEALFKQKEKEKVTEKRKEELKRAEKKDKDKQAIDEYGKWLEKKERQERIERRQKKRHCFLDNEALPPWSPPNRTASSKVFR